jgi:uncharacterized protein YprB with RNaseH-like and TPR domain
MQQKSMPLKLVTPSKITQDYWVYCQPLIKRNFTKKYKQDRIGKWLIFVELKSLDVYWKKIRIATENGYLGIAAKAATAKPSPVATTDNEKVICVYTYNWQDTDDVYRVENQLRKLGICDTLFYKADIDTLAGKYKVHGATGISKYISKGNKTYNTTGLQTIYSVGFDKAEVLKKVGIRKIDDLLSFDTSKELQGKGITSQSIHKLKLCALSQLENKIYRFAHLKVPKRNIVYFDIETDLYTTYDVKKVWSIAVYYKGSVKIFFAKTWVEERKILKQFLKFLKTIKSPNLISYSGQDFDKNVLICAFKRNKLNHSFFLQCKHLDLCSLLKKTHIFPIQKYGLKQIGEYLGYKFSNSNLDGLYVAMLYMSHQKTGKMFPPGIFKYIEDDVKALDHILKSLLHHKSIKDMQFISLEQ